MYAIYCISLCTRTHIRIVFNILNLLIEQVGVPELVAKEMTYPERVNRYNLDELKSMVINGPDVHPGM